VTTLMARPKGRPPKSRDEGARTIGFRVTESYAKWLEDVAEANRSTIAGLLDQAVASYAEAIGFKKAPPRRVP
jgi:hypothetical protein